MKNERGSAMLVVLTLTILVSSLIVINSFELGRLRRELRRIDQQEQKKFALGKAKS